MKNHKITLVIWAVFTIIILYFNISDKIKLKEHKEANKILLELNKSCSKYVLFDNVKYSSEVFYSYIAKNKLYMFDVEPPILIYRYHQTICPPCFQEDLSVLYKIQEEIGSDRILILPSYEFDQASLLSMKSDLHKFRHKNITEELFVIPKEDENVYTKYFAFINEDGNLENIFFSQYGFSDLTETFVYSIKDKLIKSQ